MTPRNLRKRARTYAAELIDAISDDDRQQLFEAPIAGVESLFECTVEQSQPRGAENCQVDGESFPRERRIVLGPTWSAERGLFTVLHELGHILVFYHDMAYEVAEHPDSDALEEAICDAFAASILIPEPLLDEILDEPYGVEVAVTLYDKTNASRSAVAVAISNRLTGPNIVVVADTDCEVVFSAASGKYRVRPGTIQPEDGPIGKAVRNGQSGGNGRLIYRPGSPTDEMHYRAVLHGNYVFGVFVDSDQPWGGLNIAAEPDRAPTPSRHCEHCSAEITSWQTCARCGVSECEECGRCGCGSTQSATARTCVDCGMQKRAHLVNSDGICRDCE